MVAKKKRTTDMPLPEQIAAYRKAGRTYARRAVDVLNTTEEMDDDTERYITGNAALAAMYFTLARDIDHFGKLPEIDEEGQ